MTKTGSNTMWGGRFAAGPDAIMEAINASIGFDKRLARQDIEGSRAHAAMLAATGILRDSDAEAIREGLLTVLSEIEGGDFAFSTALEDIHMNVESRLKEIVGEPAGRLHTARQPQRPGGDRISGSGCGTSGCGHCRAGGAATALWRRPRPVPTGSCRASPICRPRSP
jgi:hypothetical protein